VGKLICAIFGHVRRAGWWGDALYGSVVGGYRDNIGRTHFEVEADCDRCGETYTLARFHGSQLKGKEL